MCNSISKEEVWPSSSSGVQASIAHCTLTMPGEWTWFASPIGLDFKRSFPCGLVHHF
ncbi:hypothetical protein DAI22_12g026300 [Oryza sativa Japonica Group]|nr:hypothetical protein DAI22_12g026300 [Oryza sativa Japonica Group]